jgi:hypothetical protein
MSYAHGAISTYPAIIVRQVIIADIERVEEHTESLISSLAIHRIKNEVIPEFAALAINVEGDLKALVAAVEYLFNNFSDSYTVVSFGDKCEISRGVVVRIKSLICHNF